MDQVVEQVQEAVRDRYRSKALQMAAGQAGCCDGGTCCDDASTCGEGYTADDLAAVGLTPGQSLGCGNPTLLAELRPGEIVLDLGSGAGLDVLLSARRVAPGGHAFGVDMTDEMLAVAATNQERAGITNATFLKGTIEELPLPDASVDVVISNCVVNLSTDKRAVYAEIQRVLRPGGRVGITDIVAEDQLSPEDRAERGTHVGCIAGALSVAEYREGLSSVGLVDVEVEFTHAVADGMHGAIVRARKP